MEFNTIRSLQNIAGKDKHVTANDVLEKVDTDKDGTISTDEAKAADINEKDLASINKDFASHKSDPTKVLFSQEELEAKKQQSFVKTNFKNIDSDDDGYLSKSELSNAANSNKFSKDEKAIISQLRNDIGNIEEYSNDEWGDENDGITLKDMDTMVKEKEGGKSRISRTDNSEKAHGAKDFVKNNFKKIDTDNDGFLSKGELDKAIYDKTITGKDAAIVSTLRTNISEIEEYSNDEWFDENDGITMKDMEIFVNKSESDANDTTVQAVIGGYNKSEMRIKEASKQLYADSANPLSSIRLDNMAQGNINDCFFLSAVAGVVARNPQQIKDMIKDNGDGTYTVKFPGAPKPVTVTGPSDGEIGSYATSGKDGIWFNVLEKAYATIRNEAPSYHHANVRDSIDGDGDFQDSAIKLMTGHKVDTDLMPFTSKDEMRKKLMKTLNPEDGIKGIVTASTFMDGDTSKNMISNHVFTVVGYDPKTDTVTVRNPWGPGQDATGLKFPDANNDGTFTLTMDEFDEYFNLIAFEEKKPIENYNHLQERYLYKLLG